MLIELRQPSDDGRVEVLRLRHEYESMVRDGVASASAASAVRQDIPAW